MNPMLKKAYTASSEVRGGGGGRATEGQRREVGGKDKTKMWMGKRSMGKDG